jgi:hypothetical protein
MELQERLDFEQRWKYGTDQIDRPCAFLFAIKSAEFSTTASDLGELF